MGRWVGKPHLAANGIVRYNKFMMFFNTFVREFVFPYNSQWVVEKKLKPGQKFIKVGLYICIFADFSSFLMSLTWHLFPSSSLQVYFTQANLPNTCTIKALCIVSCLSIQPYHVNSSLNLVKNIFWICKSRRFFCVF